MQSSPTRLNWRTYIPADEREYELYSTAYRRSYSFIVGILIGVFGVYKMATLTENLPSSIISLLLLVYILFGFLLAEYVGSRVFVGQEVSFSKKRQAFQMVEGTWGGLLLGVSYLVLVMVLVFALSAYLT